MKLRLKILAWCHIVFGGAGVGVCALLLAGYAVRPDPEYTDELVAIFSVLGLLGLAYFVPSLVGGSACCAGGRLRA